MWYIVVHQCGTMWYIVVQCGTLCYIGVVRERLWQIQAVSKSTLIAYLSSRTLLLLLGLQTTDELYTLFTLNTYVV